MEYFLTGLSVTIGLPFQVFDKLEEKYLNGKNQIVSVCNCNWDTTKLNQFQTQQCCMRTKSFDQVA